MVVCYCPSCGKKIFLQGTPEGEYPLAFTHCGHEITIQLIEKKSKKAKK